MDSIPPMLVQMQKLAKEGEKLLIDHMMNLVHGHPLAETERMMQEFSKYQDQLILDGNACIFPLTVAQVDVELQKIIMPTGGMNMTIISETCMPSHNATGIKVEEI